MIIAVTGASGFLGKKLRPMLEAEGHSVLAVERKAGWDIRDWSGLGGLPHFDLLIHLAAQSYIPDAYEDPRSFYDTNVNGTLNMLELARLRKARVIFISSYVYGHPKYLPIDEQHEVAAVNPYGQSKIIGEDLCKAYSRDFGLDVIVFRPFNIYGVGQKDQFLLPKIIRQAATGNTIELFDSRPRRDYVAVHDMARAIIAGMNHHTPGYEVFNIGSGISYSIEEVIDRVRPHFRHEIGVKYLHQYRPDEIMDTVCDYGKAKRMLHWQPVITLEQGLGQMAAQFNAK